MLKGQNVPGTDGTYHGTDGTCPRDRRDAHQGVSRQNSLCLLFFFLSPQNHYYCSLASHFGICVAETTFHRGNVSISRCNSSQAHMPGKSRGGGVRGFHTISHLAPECPEVENKSFRCSENGWREGLVTSIAQNTAKTILQHCVLPFSYTEGGGAHRRNGA